MTLWNTKAEVFHGIETLEKQPNKKNASDDYYTRNLLLFFRKHPPAVSNHLPRSQSRSNRFLWISKCQSSNAFCTWDHQKVPRPWIYCSFINICSVISTIPRISKSFLSSSHSSPVCLKSPSDYYEHDKESIDEKIHGVELRFLVKHIKCNKNSSKQNHLKNS